MSRIHIVFFDAGGGHRQAASSLKEELDARGRHTVTLLNLQEVLEPVDVVHGVSGVRMQDVYNGLLRRGWTLGAAQVLKVAQCVIRRLERTAVPLLETLWRAEQPDLVVSVVPNVNRALQCSLTRALPEVPFVTILTDLADYPPHFWIEPEPQYFICGTAKAVQQAIAIGHQPACVFQASGMIVNKRFYEAPSIDRRSERQRLGLLPDRPTALVCFGGEGSRAISKIARRLSESGLDLQLVVICGRNHALARALRNSAWKIPVHIEEFTRDMPRFMRLSDFLIGKPGPGSLSEAFVLGLPAIVDLNRWTLPQERFNAEWVQTEELGLVVSHFSEIESAVTTMLTPGTLARLRRNVAALKNRALQEIPAMLDALIERSGRPRRAGLRGQEATTPAGTASLFRTSASGMRRLPS